MTPALTIRCCDCEDGLRSLADSSVDVIFADPPYWTGNTENKAATYTINTQLAAQQWKSFHADWDAQWATRHDYAAWCDRWIALCRVKLAPKGSLWICGTYHNMPTVTTVLQDQGWYIVRWIYAYKSNAFPNRRGDKPTAATEVLCWARPKKEVTQIYHLDLAKHYNNGKNLSDMWSIPFDSATARRLRKMEIVHPSKKAPALVERAIRISAPKENAVIADPFAGSGTTGVVVRAMMPLGWTGLLCDASPLYVAMMERRFALNQEAFVW